MMDSDVSPPTMGAASPAFLIGIAGCPSSGKTTLANTLAEIFAPFVNGQAEAEPTAPRPPDRVAVIHQDDYRLPTGQCPRASFRPRLPQDETVVAGEIQGGGRVATADADRLEAVDWELLWKDVQGLLKGERGVNVRPAGRQRVPDQLYGGEGPDQQMDAIEACATAQMLENAEGGFEGKYFTGADGSFPMLKRRLVIVEGSLLFAMDTERQSRKNEAVDASQGERPSQSPLSDSQGREDGAHEGVTGAAGERSCETQTDRPDQRATSLWKKTMQCIKSSLHPQKDPGDDQHHTDEHAQGSRDPHGNDDTRGQPRADSWTLRGLGRRVQRGALFARGPKRRRRRDSAESGGGNSPPGLVVDDEQFTVAGPGPELELPENREGADSRGEPAAAGPGRDGQAPARPGGERHGRRVYCDKSTCGSCKGKAVEGRGEQSPCRAPDEDGDVTRGGRRGGGGENARKRVRHAGDLPLPKEAGPNSTSQEKVLGAGGEQAAVAGSLSGPRATPRDAMLRRMGARLFLAARARRTRGCSEDVERRGYRAHHGRLGGGVDGVQVLMMDDVGVEDVVAWAVGEILRLMAGLEEDYRMGKRDDE